jgi:hypothetical protein
MQTHPSPPEGTANVTVVTREQRDMLLEELEVLTGIASAIEAARSIDDLVAIVDEYPLVVKLGRQLVGTRDSDEIDLSQAELDEALRKVVAGLDEHLAGLRQRIQLLERDPADANLRTRIPLDERPQEAAWAREEIEDYRDLRARITAIGALHV